MDNMNKHLTTEQIAEIREALAAGTKIVDLAEMYDVHRATISAIKNGRSHNDETKGKPKSGSAHHAAKLDEDKIFVIRYLYRNDLFNTVQLAAMFDMNPSTISRLINGEWWKDVPTTLCKADVKAEMRNILEQMMCAVDPTEQQVIDAIMDIGERHPLDPEAECRLVLKSLEAIKEGAIRRGDSQTLENLGEDLEAVTDRIVGPYSEKDPSLSRNVRGRLRDDEPCSFPGCLKPNGNPCPQCGRAVMVIDPVKFRKAWAFCFPKKSWTMVDATGAPILVEGRSLDHYESPEMVAAVAGRHGFDYRGELDLMAWARQHPDKGWCLVNREGDILTIEGQMLAGYANRTGAKRDARVYGISYEGLWFESLKEVNVVYARCMPTCGWCLVMADGELLNAAFSEYKNAHEAHMAAVKAGLDYQGLWGLKES